MRMMHCLTNPEFRRHEIERRRRERAYHQRFLQFKQRHGNVLQHTLNDINHKQKTVLIVGVNFPEVEIELGLIKALELAGFTPVVLILHRRQNLKYYTLAAVKEAHAYVSTEDSTPPKCSPAKA
jgi:hypothetical protein